MTQHFQIIDTHAHIDLEDFDDDRLDVISRSQTGIFPEIKGKKLEMGDTVFSIAAMILPGITAESSQRTAAWSRQYHNLFFPGVGIHPNYSQDAGENDWKIIETLSEDPAVVAIGETGLDFHWDYSPYEIQEENLYRHIFLAKRRRLPIIIHCREAEEALLSILRPLRDWENGSPLEGKIPHPLFTEENRALPPLTGVVHSFSGGPETAKELLRLGFYLGFTGSVTFGKKFAPIGEAAKIVPEDRFLLETDSPFLVPHPFRGKLERNEPLMSAFTAKKLGELRQCETGTIITQAAQNACRLFGERLRVSLNSPKQISNLS